MNVINVINNYLNTTLIDHKSILSKYYYIFFEDRLAYREKSIYLQYGTYRTF
ncbi:hypothetical protein J2W48_002404 [Flavobacterium piscis]|uniref:Uncharacterized protein n=1 Tax=Flavobacterium piscis TaxID=1114874 RepID=A0ABU1Y8I4_9FLAO|nr:hypothetical protein [Flavobacterium piscis]